MGHEKALGLTTIKKVWLRFISEGKEKGHIDQKKCLIRGGGGGRGRQSVGVKKGEDIQIQTRTSRSKILKEK